jgi:rhamnose transport system ATP-binding protein
VLRDGRSVWTRPAADTSEGEIIRSMVGRPLDQLFVRHRTEAADKRERLKIVNLSSPGAFADVSLTVHAGEVVGLAGLVGAGRSEIANAIVGLRPTSAGEVIVDGETVKRRTPRRLRGLGLVYLPEDRDGVGLVTTHAIRTNLTLAILDRISRFGALLLRKEAALAQRLAEDLAIKARRLDDPVSTLSGGNRQKVVLGKWLAAEPGVLILDEPTHGIDVGTKAQVHRIIAGLAEKGKAILMISSDLPEILGVSDRIIVVRDGRIVDGFARGEADQERVMAAAAGARRAA